MSWQLVKWAIEDAPVEDVYETLVLVVLCEADHGGGDGAFLAVETIRARARMKSPRGVQKVLRRLEDAGVVEAEPRDGKTTVYRPTPARCSPPNGVHPAHHAPRTACGANVETPTPAPGSPEPIGAIETATQSLSVDSRSDSAKGNGNGDTRETGELFAYWQQQCGHPHAKLSAERRRKIAGRLREGFTPQQIREAIDGAARGAFVNEAGAKFDDVELICRSASKLESFIARASLPAGSGNGKPSDLAAKDLAALNAMMGAAA